jgi:hypothetical protein
MITNHRVSMGFAKFKDNTLALFAHSVILNLTDNPAFPALPVSLPDLGAAVAGFRTAKCDTALGGILQTVIKIKARNDLISLLRDEAHYVQIIGRNDLTALLSSGFTAVDRNTAQAPLPVPTILKMNNQHSGQLWLTLKSIPNARAYQVRLKIGAGEWMDAGSYSQARKIVVPNLTPGTRYDIEVRAVGGSTGCSSWSMMTNIIAT